MFEERIAELNGASQDAPNKKSYSVAEIRQILGDKAAPTAYKLIKQNVFQSVRRTGGIKFL